MIIGGKIGGRTLSKSSAEELFKTFEYDLKNFIDLIDFEGYFYSIDESSVFIRSSYRNEIGSLSIEYKNYLHQEPVFRKNRVNFFRDEDYRLEINSNFFTGTFFLRRSWNSPEEGAVELLFGRPLFKLFKSDSKSFFDGNLNLKIEAVYSIEVSVEKLIIEMDRESKELQNLQSIGGIKIEVEKTIRSSDLSEEQFKNLVVSCFYGEYKGILGGMDIELKNLKDMMEENENKTLMNSSKILMYNPMVMKATHKNCKDFAFRFYKPSIKISDNPTSLKILAEPAGKDSQKKP